MADREFALNVLNAISAPGPLNAAGFQPNPDAGGNVARLITTVLRARLPGSERLTAKSARWEGGVVAFKNFTPDLRFWTKVTQRDLDGADGPSAWVCSSVDREKAVLHVWVLGFSIIRDVYDRLPEDVQHRRDLQIVPRQGGWSFRFGVPPRRAARTGRVSPRVQPAGAGRVRAGACRGRAAA